MTDKHKNPSPRPRLGPKVTPEFARLIKTAARVVKLLGRGKARRHDRAGVGVVDFFGSAEPGLSSGVEARVTNTITTGPRGPTEDTPRTSLAGSQFNVVSHQT